MPTYSYECQACGHKFEQHQKFADQPITRCPNCKKNKVRRLFEPAAIVFKGSGWYKTDSRSKATSTRSEKPSEKTGEKTAEASASTDKPADSSSSNGNGSSESSSDGKKEKPKKEVVAPKSDD